MYENAPAPIQGPVVLLWTHVLDPGIHMLDHGTHMLDLVERPHVPVDSYVGPWGIQIQLRVVFVSVFVFVVVVVVVVVVVSVSVSVFVFVCVFVSVLVGEGGNNNHNNYRPGGLERTVWTHMLDPGGPKFN